MPRQTTSVCERRQVSLIGKWVEWDAGGGDGIGWVVVVVVVVLTHLIAGSCRLWPWL